MSTPRRSLVSVSALATLVMILLAGCGPSSEDDPTMDHINAAAELDGLLLIAQDTVSSEWKRSDRGAEACELPSGSPGARYIFNRYGQGIVAGEQQPILNAVVAGWTAADLVATVSPKSLGDVDFTEVRYPAAGYGVDGLYLRFELGENSASVQGQSRCVPGDYAQINSDYQATKNDNPEHPLSPGENVLPAETTEP